MPDPSRPSAIPLDIRLFTPRMRAPMLTNYQNSSFTHALAAPPRDRVFAIS
jgi:hypothetical protein